MSWILNNIHDYDDDDCDNDDNYPIGLGWMKKKMTTKDGQLIFKSI